MILFGKDYIPTSIENLKNVYFKSQLDAKYKVTKQDLELLTGDTFFDTKLSNGDMVLFFQYIKGCINNELEIQILFLTEKELKKLIGDYYITQIDLSIPTIIHKKTLSNLIYG